MGFREERHTVHGVETVVLSAGEGEPLVYFHGAGTTTGFDALLPLAERFRLIVPFHPGWGPSEDDPTIDDVHDFRRHYLDLFDALGLGEIALAGSSMGGWIAANFAADHGERVRSLVLVSPVGLRVDEHPTTDIFSIPDDEVFGRLTEDMSVFEGHVPMPPTPEFLADRYREATSAARVMWARSYDLKLHRWLHRLRMPTLLLWGGADRLIPVEQADVWAGLIPGAEVKRLPGVGHLVFEEALEACEIVASFVEARTRAPAAS
jgi:pimeloyl-ACP methyl ester carboxylesterase